MDNLDRRCFVEQLYKLKESSKEAVENLNTFSDFKKYMHITRHVEKELESLILKANEANSSQLILVCGGVGDGKSHIISYFKHKYPEILGNFTLWNDATESLQPELTAMDTLNEILDDFSDDNLKYSNKKFILAINLGTLNNFIDSKYQSRYSKLKSFVESKKILESSIEDNEFNEKNSFQFINFGDYHLYTIKNGKAKSDYMKKLFDKVTNKSDSNIFYNSYRKNCINCDSSKVCPIKLNYELLMNKGVQDVITELLIEVIIKNKIIISTRNLLNFVYDILVSGSLNVNSARVKANIVRLNSENFINALMCNLLFENEDASFIFKSLANLDPLKVRNDNLDDLIIKFNNSSNFISYFDENIDYPIGYLEKINDVKLDDSKGKDIKLKLLKLFIRSFRVCGVGSLISLKDDLYDKYISDLYYWNKGDKANLKTLYLDIRDGILKWNGECEKDSVNVLLGKNQLKYTISEELGLKPDTSDLYKNNDEELNKFLSNIIIKYKTDKSEESYEIDIDFSLYELLYKIKDGYRPNFNDRNHNIKFVEFLNNLIKLGSQKEKIFFVEKNKDTNKRYKLEYDEEFGEFTFIER